MTLQEIVNNILTSADLTNFKATETATSDSWQAITNWLGKLYLLQGVPFHYLVPDENMLPPESLKFFCVDQNWLTALIDGAYSIGRTASKDNPTLSNALEAIFYPVLMNDVKNAATNERLLHLKKETSLPLLSNLPTRLSGFLLRSQAVKDFKNMQVVGYPKGGIPSDSTAGSPLSFLRLEHLAPDILIGIFEGLLYRLDLREPSEGLHHGFDYIEYDSDGVAVKDPSSKTKQYTYIKELRNPAGTEETLAKITSAANLFRTPPDPSDGYAPKGAVINMNALSSEMYSTLNSASYNIPYSSAPITYSAAAEATLWPATKTNLTSADFALQFTEGVSMVSFCFDPPPS